MGIAASIISAVIKSVVMDKFGSGLAKDLIGISIDEVSQKGINEIADFINSERLKIDSVFFKENIKSLGIPEDNIDYAVAEIKDLFSMIDITDEVLRQCKYDSMNLSAFLWNEYCSKKGGYIECENEIKTSLFAVAEALINLVRESKNFEKDVLIHISNSGDDTNVELQKISEYMDSNFGKLNADNRVILEILQIILKQNQEESTKNKDKKQKIKSRTQEYADKWEANMFLNDFDKRDENAGINVKLCEVYLEEHLPHYIWHKNSENNPSTDLKELLSEYINKNRDNKMLLVLGQPGIGKSTLITWITTHFSERIDDILVYRFASDLENIDWKDGRISNRILEKLGFNHSDLNDKILILDGFDEVSIEPNRRRAILDSLYGDWINNKITENFSLIITCRENYVSQFAILKCKYITLKPWDETQIRSFCDIFQEKTKNSVSMDTMEKLLENKEILGIPLILYMTLALDISIEKEGSIVDIYDRIFSLDGGIYDRCIENKNFDESHRIGDVKKQIHQISRDIAMWMFEINLGRESIPQEEFLRICDEVVQKDVPKSTVLENDFLIGTYFRLVKHCEGTEAEEVYFVHRTIYEYFVAETIYSSIENSMIELSEKSQEELAGNIAIYLKQGVIIGEIGNYLKYKILKSYNKKLDNKKREIFYQWWEKLIENMMNMGMFYYVKKVANYANIINKETQCFANLIEILRLLFSVNRKAYIFEDTDHVLLMRYIKHSLVESKIIYIDGIEIDNMGSVCERYVLDLSKLDLKKAYLEKCDLSMVDLSRTNLRYSTLRQANLKGANLQEANLEGADLWEADLRNAQLQFAHLESANLSRAILIGANLIRADLRKTYLIGVDLSDVELEQSEWNSSDVKKIFPRLKSARFTYIIVADRKKKKLYKNELFPDTNSSSDSIFGDNELRQSLEEAGIDLLDFVMMDDYEKMKTLEDAGLDSDMY